MTEGDKILVKTLNLLKQKIGGLWEALGNVVKALNLDNMTAF